MRKLLIQGGTSSFVLMVSAPIRQGEAVEIIAETPWLRAWVISQLSEDEVRDWAYALEQLQIDGFGSHSFHAREGWGELTFVMGKRGHLHLSLRLQSAPDFLDEVRLFMNLEQSELPEIVRQLRELLG